MTRSDTHVAVLYGGWSAEREVSLDTGKGCIQALKNAGYTVTPIDADHRIAAVLEELRPDVVFNALHGRWGEDGCVQGILECLEIPYTHSGVLASALAMDKHQSKVIFRAAGLPVADSKVVTRAQAALGHPMATPYVIKPVNEGSSVGVYIIEEEASQLLERALSGGGNPGDRLMVERYVAGRELTCAVMGDVALGIIDIQPATEFYDYKAKYAPGGSRHILPAEIPEEVYRRVQHIALKAHKALGCRGVSRSDFRYDDRPSGTGELVILETNTQPGMTSTSLVPEIAAHAGHSFEDLVSWMVEDASCGR
jgi:D-alanine-D-alanine ligase